jgi:uncharacterized protein
MHQETIALMPSAPGGHRHLSVLRFGSPDARPKATLQAALHADEIPPMLVAWHLRSLLTELETAGQIRGCVQRGLQRRLRSRVG